METTVESTYRELTEGQSPGEIAGKSSSNAHDASHRAFHHSDVEGLNVRNKIASMKHSSAAAHHANAAKSVNDHHGTGAALKHYHKLAADFHTGMASLHSAPSKWNDLVPKHYSEETTIDEALEDISEELFRAHLLKPTKDTWEGGKWEHMETSTHGNRKGYFNGVKSTYKHAKHGTLKIDQIAGTKKSPYHVTVHHNGKLIHKGTPESAQKHVVQHLEF